MSYDQHQSSAPPPRMEKARKSSDSSMVLFLGEFSGDLLTQPISSAYGTRTKENISEFKNVIFDEMQYVWLVSALAVKRVKKGTDALLLNEQCGYFQFGNAASKFVAIRQAIRGLLRRTMGISENKWFKSLLLAHENTTMLHQSIDIAKSYPRIETRERFKDIQKSVILQSITFG